MPNSMGDPGALQPSDVAASIKSPWGRFTSGLSNLFSSPGMGGGAVPPPAMGMGAPYPGYTSGG
jgi:hypothetical protein